MWPNDIRRTLPARSTTAVVVVRRIQGFDLLPLLTHTQQPVGKGARLAVLRRHRTSAYLSVVQCRACCLGAGSPYKRGPLLRTQLRPLL